jgi:hypothetical protein
MAKSGQNPPIAARHEGCRGVAPRTVSNTASISAGRLLPRHATWPSGLTSTSLRAYKSTTSAAEMSIVLNGMRTRWAARSMPLTSS